MTDPKSEIVGLAERLDSVASGMRGYGLREIAWNKSMELRPSDLTQAAKYLRATLKEDENG